MTIRVSVRLFNKFQRLLPPELEGKTEWVLPEGSCVKDVYRRLDISRPHTIAVNGVIERDLDRILEEGDQVSVFSPVSGG